MKLVTNLNGKSTPNPYSGWVDISDKLADHPLNKSQQIIYKAIRNNYFMVQFSKFETNNGEMIHLWIFVRDKKEPTWHQKQEIKNAVIGKDRCAIEMYPEEKNLAKESSIYHLYVFPAGFEPTFGLHMNNECL